MTVTYVSPSSLAFRGDMTGAEFVRHVMMLLDVATAAGLAEKMHWRRGMERTVARWLAGSSEPSFSYTIDMATRAGILVLDGVSQPNDLDRPEAIAGRYARILENQKEALTGQERIFDELAELRRLLPSPARAARTSPKQSR